MTYLYSFLICGTFCLVAQLLYEFTKLTPGHITSLFVVIGVLLEPFGAYKFLLDIAPGGASLPIVNFGYQLANAAVMGAKENGFLGILQSLLVPASLSLSSVVILSSIVALIGKPHP